MLAAAGERLAVDVADAQALKARAASGDPAALRSAARQFESLMVAQMLKTMRSTRFAEEDDPMTGGDGVKLYRELLDQQWAAKISNGRGLGFAEMMVKAMESRGMSGTREPSPVAINSAGDLPAPPVSANLSAPAHFSLPFKGRAGVGMGENSAASDPIPLLTSPLKGEELGKAALTSPFKGDELGKAALTSPFKGDELGKAALTSPSKGEELGKAALMPVTASVSNRKQAFLDAMQPHADAAAAATGVPSRYILAHAALESGWGEREIRGQNGEASHNLFGLKAGRNWDGATVQTLTTEYRQGLAVKLTQSFRAYDDYSAGFTDYAKVLKSRYGAALAAGANDDAFASGLAAGGYATDPAYAGKLKSVIASLGVAAG
jgi:flagellar protein FlgJ